MGPQPCQHVLRLCFSQSWWELQASLLTCESCDSLLPRHCATVSSPSSSPGSPVSFCSSKQQLCLPCAYARRRLEARQAPGRVGSPQGFGVCCVVRTHGFQRVSARVSGAGKWRQHGREPEP